jgi:hypothetical protein
MFSPVTTTSPMRHARLHLDVAGIRGTKDESTGTFQKAMLF